MAKRVAKLEKVFRDHALQMDDILADDSGGTPTTALERATEKLIKRGGGGGGGGGESFLRVHWVAVPEALRARRVNRQHGAGRRRRPQSGVSAWLAIARGWPLTCHVACVWLERVRGAAEAAVGGTERRQRAAAQHAAACRGQGRRHGARVGRRWGGWAVGRGASRAAGRQASQARPPGGAGSRQGRRGEGAEAVGAGQGSRARTLGGALMDRLTTEVSSYVCAGLDRWGCTGTAAGGCAPVWRREGHVVS
jgi:hypothetical protein